MRNIAPCPPTGNEPNVLDDFHYLETSEMIIQNESGDIETEPSYLCDAELEEGEKGTQKGERGRKGTQQRREGMKRHTKKGEGRKGTQKNWRGERCG